MPAHYTTIDSQSTTKYFGFSQFISTEWFIPFSNIWKIIIKFRYYSEHTNTQTHAFNHDEQIWKTKLEIKSNPFLRWRLFCSLHQQYDPLSTTLYAWIKIIRCCESNTRISFPYTQWHTHWFRAMFLSNAYTQTLTAPLTHTCMANLFLQENNLWVRERQKHRDAHTPFGSSRTVTAHKASPNVFVSGAHTNVKDSLVRLSDNVVFVQNRHKTLKPISIVPTHLDSHCFHHLSYAVFRVENWSSRNNCCSCSCIVWMKEKAFSHFSGRQKLHPFARWMLNIRRVRCALIMKWQLLTISPFDNMPTTRIKFLTTGKPKALRKSDYFCPALDGVVHAFFQRIWINRRYT